MHDYLHFSCLETTTELKGKPPDYFKYLHELIIVKKLMTVCLSSKELKLKHNVTGSKLNSQLFLKISLINCSKTLSRALIHEDI